MSFFGDTLNQLYQSASKAAQDAFNTAAKTTQKAIATLEQGYHYAQDKAYETYNSVKGKIVPVYDYAKQKALQAKDLAIKTVDTVKKSVKQQVQVARQAAPKKLAPHPAGSHTATCPLEQNWIELNYLYCDGTGVGGASYRVIFDDTGAVVAQGKLDANGYAKCFLPVSINNVSYNFYKDPPTVCYRKQPIPNPERAKVKPGWFERIGNGIADTGSWVWEAVQGDFNEDQTVGQIATNAVITMIPLVDQAGDARDIVANLKFLIWDKRYNDKWVWIALVITLIGAIPVLGSAAKGVLKTIVKGLKTTGKVPLTLLIDVLNKFHKGHAVEWLRKLAAELPSHGAKVKSMLSDILRVLREKMQWLAANLPGSLGKNAQDTVASIDDVSKIASGKIDESIKELQNGLNKSLDDELNFESKGATKSKNTRVQGESEPPDLISTSAKNDKKALENLRKKSSKGDKDATYELNKTSNTKGSRAENAIADQRGDQVIKAGEQRKTSLTNTEIDIETKTEVIESKSGDLRDYASGDQIDKQAEYARSVNKEHVVAYDKNKYPDSNHPDLKAILDKYPNIRLEPWDFK